MLIVDDHVVVRQGLRQLIDQTTDLMTCGEASTGAEAEALMPAAQADVVLLDLSLELSNGLEYLKRVRARGLRVPVLVLSMHEEVFYAERALKAGAQGYVMKSEPAGRVLDGLRCVAEGGLFFSDSMSARLLRSAYAATPSPDHRRAGIERLTDRELEIFEWIGRGAKTSAIAKRLNLSVKTVETHRANIKRKLQLSSGNELTHLAIRWIEGERRLPRRRRSRKAD